VSENSTTKTMGNLITTMASMKMEEHLEEQVYFCTEYM
jgi:hypothetical protein